MPRADRLARGTVSPRPARAIAVGLWACLVMAPGALGSDPARAAPENAVAWLARMAQALHEREYEGTLISLHGPRLTAVRVAHRHADGHWRDSLLALSGPLRAIARDERGVSCLRADDAPLLIERSASPPSSTPVLDEHELATHYLIRTQGVTRVAGREAEDIALVARDRFRYGYRFALDRLSALPLKIELHDGSNTTKEQVMFAEVQIFPPRPVPAVLAASPSPAPLDPATTRWRFVQPPPGFVLRDYRRRDHGADGTVEHFLFSDGLATVSVYIAPETGAEKDEPALREVLRLGAFHVAERRLADHRATAVGEVPAATVIGMLRALRVVNAGAVPGGATP